MTNNMLKHITLLLVFGTLLTFNTAMAQSSITIEGSQVISNFKFKDSAGTKDKNYSPTYHGSYNIGYTYTLDMGVFLNLGVGMRKAGATLVLDGSNYQWDLQYGQARLTAGYAYDLGRIKPYLKVAGYYGFLLKANQTINNEDFDIIDSGSIEKGDAGMYISGGAKMDVSDAIAVYAEYSYLLGLKNVETTTGGQVAKNSASILTLGLSFSIQQLSE